MWWSEKVPSTSRRRILGLPLVLLLAPATPLALGACGFRPLYGGVAGKAVAAELAAIQVEAPKTRLGRILENELIDALNPEGRSTPAIYHLDVELQRDKKALAIQLDERVTRYDLTLAAFFTLRPIEALPAEADDDNDDEGDASVSTLYRSAVRRVASYNVILEPFATLVAERDAERRAAVQVSRQIRTLLTIHFENGAA